MVNFGVFVARIKAAARYDPHRYADTRVGGLTLRPLWCIFTPMDNRPVTTKIPVDALRLLRMIAASTGERQYEVLNRLMASEAKRLRLPHTTEGGR